MQGIALVYGSVMSKTDRDPDLLEFMYQQGEKQASEKRGKGRGMMG